MILLATCNGGESLDGLLESLFAQDYASLKILARDDGSSDNTPAILQRWRDLHPQRLIIIEHDGLAPAGIHRNFAALQRQALDQSDDDALYLYCDQDDLWHPAKISRLVHCLADCDPRRPALAWSDMRVVDDAGKVISESFLDYQQLAQDAPLSRLLVQNRISGCASLFNRAALELATPLPAEALMHDWWLALLVAATGQTRFWPQALLDYRQHDQNAVGAQGYGAAYLLRRAVSGSTGLNALYRQVDSLTARLSERDENTPVEFDEFAATATMSRARRAWIFWRSGFTKRGWLRNIPLWVGPSRSARR